jgi:RNA repair pathway DNA polymerase beta family
MQSTEHTTALAALHATLGPRQVVFAAFHGSRLYGTATPTSDLDVRAVFLPTPEEILLGRIDFTLDNNPEKKPLGLGDVDVAAFSFARFLRLLGKFDVNAIEMLFASQPGTPALLASDADLMARVRGMAHQLVATGGSSPIGHARAILGALAPDQDSYVDAFQTGVQALLDAKTEADPEGKGLKLYAVPGLVAKLRSLPGAVYRAHGRNADAIVLEEDIPLDAIAAGRWKEHTLFVTVADRMLSTSMTVHEAEAVLRKPLRRMQGEVAARRARLEGVAVSPKDMYHALRILWQFVEIQATGSLTFPRPQAGVLRDVRNGLTTGEALQSLIDAAFEEALAAKDRPMPFAVTPDTVARDALLVDVHKQVVLATA